MTLEALRAELGDIKTEDNPAIVKQKSRDFYWYSPVLKERLDHVTGDLLVSPANEDELIGVMRACYRHGIPITPRGSGTGNYGQAMPLSGGVVLSLAEMNEIRKILPGRLICGPGAILSEIDKATRAHSGQEMRMHPSTYHTATIGGFIAGGSGGVGSIRWGGLRSLGNILRLRVVTMEEEPRVLELTGQDLHKVMHAYGTNGIITEVEIPLTAAYEWADMIVAFDDFMKGARFANALAREDGILTKLATVVAAPAPHDYFKRHQKFLEPGDNVVIVMVAAHALDAFQTFCDQFDGRIAFNSSAMTAEERKGIPPGFELTWNHTTLRGLRVDPKITYLQVHYPFPRHLELVEKLNSMFEGEIIGHLEFIRFDGNVICSGLPMVRYSTEQRLDEIIATFEKVGAPIFNPHRYTLEEGGMKQTNEVQLDFKRQTDPKGLLNPGKMIAWDDPGYDLNTGRLWLFKGLQKAS